MGMTQQATTDLMRRIEMLEELAMRSQKAFRFYTVPTLEDLADLQVAPPAIAYVEENCNYFFMYPWSSDLVDTPYNSVIGRGWHNMDSPTPRYDRMIHVIHTQWLNGWNLDYYPDYVDSSQGGYDYEFLKDLFGEHHGPPAKQSDVQILPDPVTVDGSAGEGNTSLYLSGITKPLNALCTLTLAGATYSIVGWDTNNALPKWVTITPGLVGAVEDATLGSVRWPDGRVRYSGTLSAHSDAGTSTLEISGLGGPIDTSYQLIIAGNRYKIIDFTPIDLPTTITIAPALQTDLAQGTPWSMLKKQGDYNTTIRNMKPGDLIFRSQIWKGTVNGNHAAGATTVNIAGVDTEIGDRWSSSHSISHDDAGIRNASQAGCSLYVGSNNYQIVDHEPSARSEHGYVYANLGQGTPDNPDFNQLEWLPTGKPTTKVFLRSGLTEPLANGTEFIIKNKHWYVVSVEHLGSDDATTVFDTPEFPEGHNRKCMDFFNVASGESPARFEMMLHVIASEEAFDRLFDEGKIIPGDLAYHERWHNWYQVLPRYEGKQLQEDEISFGDFSRSLIVHDRKQFDFFAKHFQFNNLWVINNTHGRQVVDKQLVTGLDSDGNLTYSKWSRYRYHPAEFVYYPGVTEESVR